MSVDSGTMGDDSGGAVDSGSPSSDDSGQGAPDTGADTNPPGGDDSGSSPVPHGLQRRLTRSYGCCSGGTVLLVHLADEHPFMTKTRTGYGRLRVGLEGVLLLRGAPRRRAAGASDQPASDRPFLVAPRLSRRGADRLPLRRHARRAHPTALADRPLALLRPAGDEQVPERVLSLLPAVRTVHFHRAQCTSLARAIRSSGWGVPLTRFAADAIGSRVCVFRQSSRAASRAELPSCTLSRFPH